MKKNNETALKYAVFSQIEIQPTNGMPEPPEMELDETQLKAVLDEIFSVDPISGFPKGDIQYYLSSEGNPQVKQWLENNLLKPRISSSKNPEGVTDDMIAEFSQKKNESVSAYAERLKSIYDSARAEYEKSFESQELIEPKTD